MSEEQKLWDLLLNAGKVEWCERMAVRFTQGETPWTVMGLSVQRRTVYLARYKIMDEVEREAMAGAYVAFKDQATIGALLGQLRRKWKDGTLFLQPTVLDPGWIVMKPWADGNRALKAGRFSNGVFKGRSEAMAILQGIAGAPE